MAIAVDCSCGQSFELKDELAGSIVKCPACGEEIRVRDTERQPQADAAFDRDVFLFRPERLAISLKYYVWDEQGQKILFVERPVFLIRAMLAMLAAVLVAVFFLATAFAVVAVINPESKVLVLVVGIVLVVCGGFAALALWIFIIPKRHVRFYRDDSRQELLLEVLQDRKSWLWNATYSVRDGAGILLAGLRTNYLYNVFRTRWDCLTPAGATVCVVANAVDFVFRAGDTDQVIGKLTRDVKFWEKYELDFGDDPQRSRDRRIALALAIRLDMSTRPIRSSI